MAHEDIPLGKQTDYPKQYDPNLLFRIPRAKTRSVLLAANPNLCLQGYDLWTLYELNWIDSLGSPKAVIGELRIPATSEYIVESKSLKLYLNSLYYRQFANIEDMTGEIEQTLSALLESEVELRLCSASDYKIGDADDRFVDLDRFGAQLSDTMDTKNILVESRAGEQHLYKTDCFRSLCPVTSQPDWASVYIGVLGARLSELDLAKYLLSYSEHNGFHESCVEQIFADIMRVVEPEQLTVAARFTRRGGIDINPYRTTDNPVFDLPQRTARQ